tara:strand:+ start:93 stop:941 length:849 start_codon:yes stop_codon:yes gene_type:complete
MNFIEHDFPGTPPCVYFDEIKKSWPDNGKPTYFFWSLGGENLRKIKILEERGIDYWIVDAGYITYNTARFREENIPLAKYDVNKVHVRLTKNSMHNDLTNVSDDDTRLKKLIKDDVWYPSKLESYEEKEISPDSHLLVTPSSRRVCKYYGYKDQQAWLEEIVAKCRWHSKRYLELRLKPMTDLSELNSKRLYKGKTLFEQLENSSGVVTSMSMTAIDSIINGYPAFVHEDHVCSSIAETDLKNINNMKPVKKEDIYTWMAKAANCQFTLEEFKSGEVYEYIK